MNFLQNFVGAAFDPHLYQHQFNTAAAIYYKNSAANKSLEFEDAAGHHFHHQHDSQPHQLSQNLNQSSQNHVSMFLNHQGQRDFIIIFKLKNIYIRLVIR
jgi:hypothetical protein